MVPTGASEDESDYDPCPDPLEPTVEKFCKGPADILPGPVCKLNIVGLGSGSKLSWYRQGRNRENKNYTHKNILLTLFQWLVSLHAESRGLEPAWDFPAVAKQRVGRAILGFYAFFYYKMRQP